MYHYLSGYTAKVAGTELGVKEPQATFSACFGKAFLMVHPTKYAEILAEKMDQHKSQAYLINTGWVGGKYGVGKRISLLNNRKTIDYIFEGTLDKAAYETLPVLNLNVPRSLPGIDASLNPRDAWAGKEEYDAMAKQLASMFIKNFDLFKDSAIGRSLTTVGPKLP
jgi:phosphoenolpyruvate carboxykinase (ATP)